MIDVAANKRLAGRLGHQQGQAETCDDQCDEKVAYDLYAKTHVASLTQRGMSAMGREPTFAYRWEADIRAAVCESVVGGTD